MFNFLNKFSSNAKGGNHVYAIKLNNKLPSQYYTVNGAIITFESPKHSYMFYSAIKDMQKEKIIIAKLPKLYIEKTAPEHQLKVIVFNCELHYKVINTSDDIDSIRYSLENNVEYCEYK